jgi:PAS domain S-box-containing protein
MDRLDGHKAMAKIEPHGTATNRPEKNLRDSEEIYRELADSINDIFFILDRDLKFIYWNKSAERLTGIPAKEAIRKSLYELFPEVKGTKADKIYRHVLKTKKAQRFETKYRFKNKDSVFEISACPSQNGLSVFVRDITKLKQAEESLRANEKEIRQIINNLPGLVSYLDTQGRYRYINKQYSDWFKTSQKDILGKHYRQVLGESAYQRLKDRVSQALSGHRVSFEDEVPYKSGGTRWVRANYVPDFDELGKVKGIFVLVEDISNQEAVDKQFLHMAQNIQEAFWLAGIGKSRRILYLSPAFKKLWGLKPQVAYQDHKVMREAIYKDDKERFARILKDYEQGKAVNLEFRIVRPDGSLRWVWAKGFPIRDQAGKIFRMAGLAQDITERKLAEEALQNSEKRFRTLVDNIPGAVYRYDKDGRMRFISDEIETIIGYPASDFIDNKVRSFTSIVHPNDVTKVIDCTSDCLLNMGHFEMDYRLIHKDGSIHWVHDIFRGIKENDGQNWIDGVLFDITEHRQVEEELRESRTSLRNLATRLQSVREEERTRIAREIHDEVGQALAAIKMDLSWMRKKLEKGQKLPEGKIQSMSQLTETTIQTVRRIATELRPRLLDDLGLAAAIEWQAKDFQKLSGIRTSVAVKTGDLYFSEESKTAIFRIVQEALANVAQHAEATKVRISVGVIGNNMELKIQDNGKGIAAEQISDPESLGLLGMRERAESLAGEIMIKGTPNKGTRILARIPVTN